MTNDGFIEVNGYYATIYSDPSQDGSWWSWVLFERKHDFDDMKTQIKAVRHRVPSTFESQQRAVEAAYAYANHVTGAGDVGL